MKRKSVALTFLCTLADPTRLSILRMKLAPVCVRYARHEDDGRFDLIVAELAVGGSWQVSFRHALLAWP